MLPVIALTGRPNVGKSTLFNRITASNHAITSELPGLTRDRQYGLARFESTSFILIDAGGVNSFESKPSGIEGAIYEQSKIAIAEADIVILLVDAIFGFHPVDADLVQFLRKRKKEFHLIVNKIDGCVEETATSEFFRLGVDSIFAVAAKHGRGVKKMLGAILRDFEENTVITEDSLKEGSIKLAVVGRPNVGKSTLVNQFLGEDRLVVFDQPGTTRDSIYIPFERKGIDYTFIDTAGARRPSRIRDSVERYSIAKTIQAIANAHVVLVVIDAIEGVVDQDLNLLGHCLNAGRGLVLVVNKWDNLQAPDRDWIKSQVLRKLNFIEFADLHFISALQGTRIRNLYKSIQNAYNSTMVELGTPDLNKTLKRAQEKNPPPMVSGRRLKMRYAHQGGNNPPRIIIHANQTKKVPVNYIRYLEKFFINEFSLHGAPLRLEFRSGENPFSDIPNRLTSRQTRRRKRMLRHVKKRRKLSRR